MTRKKENNHQLKKLSCTRYTYDAWKKCYPQSNYEEWKEVAHPDCLMDFYYSVLDTMNVEEPEFNVRVVTLDEEYFKWLNGKPDTATARANYAKSVTDETATRLMKKNKMDKITGMYFIPAIFFSEKEGETISLKVTDKLRNRIKKNLEKTIDASVYVPGVVISTENLSNYTDDDYDAIYETLLEETTDKNDLVSLRKTKEAGVACVDFMPIKVTHTVDTALIKPNDYAQPENKGFSIFSSCWDVFTNKEISEKNKNGVVVIDPIVYDIDELPQAYEEITKTLVNMLNKMTDSVEEPEAEYYA